MGLVLNGVDSDDPNFKNICKCLLLYGLSHVNQS